MSRETRRARNQTLLREANHRIADMSLQHAADGVWQTFACECSRSRCRSTVEAPLGVYAAVAAHTSTYLVRVGHEDRKHEAVMVGQDAYRIVDRPAQQDEPQNEPERGLELEHHQAVVVSDAPSHEKG